MTDTAPARRNPAPRPRLPAVFLAAFAVGMFGTIAAYAITH